MLVVAAPLFCCCSSPFFPFTDPLLFLPNRPLPLPLPVLLVVVVVVNAGPTWATWACA